MKTKNTHEYQMQLSERVRQYTEFVASRGRAPREGVEVPNMPLAPNELIEVFETKLLKHGGAVALEIVERKAQYHQRQAKRMNNVS